MAKCVYGRNKVKKWHDVNVSVTEISQIIVKKKKKEKNRKTTVY